MAFPVILARIGMLASRAGAGALQIGRSAASSAGSAVLRGLAIDIITDPRNVDQVAEDARKRIVRRKQAALQRTALAGINIILKRTAKGEGYEGAFAPYSDSYSLIRTAAGRGTTPNLLWTGTMLGSMTSEVVSSNEARIFFTTQESSKKAAFNNKLRPFFGFNENEKNSLRRVFFKELMK